MLTVVTWFWGTKYLPDYVRKLQNGLQRHLKLPYRFLVATDKPELFPDTQTVNIAGDHLITCNGCFARLRMFDPQWQEDNAIERLVCMDLDAVITGSLDKALSRTEPFVILQGANASNPCPYNGSLWMLQKGYRPDIWTTFSFEEALRVPYDKFPDDQAWFAAKMPGAAGWQAGKEGIYAFMKPGWPAPDPAALPEDASLVVFPGWRDPARFKHVPWIKEHWV